MGFKKRARLRRQEAEWRQYWHNSDFDPEDPKQMEMEIVNRLLAIMRQFHLTQIVYDKKRPDVTKVGSCVAESRVLARILNDVGVKAKVVCTDMAVFNENCRRLIIHKNIQREGGLTKEMGNPEDLDEATHKKLADRMGKILIKHAKSGMDLRFLSEQFDEETKWATNEPFSVTVYHEQAQELGKMESKYGHDGHCVVETDHFIIDPTLGQTWRAGLLDPPAQIIVEKEAFKKVEPADSWISWIRPDWSYTFRSGEKDENGLSPIVSQKTTDLVGLLTPIAVKHDQVTIQRVEKDTFLAYAIRPDKKIRRIYERWNHPEFRSNTKKQCRWIMRAYNDIFGTISQGKIIDKGGKVRNG